MKLRDESLTLDELCASLDIDRTQLEKKMEDAGFTYDEATNSFR